MKKYLLSLIAIMIISFNCNFAAEEESAVVADEQPVAEQVDAEEAQNPWVSLGFDALSIIITSLSAVIVAIVIGYARKGAKKLGIDINETIEKLIEEYTVKGIGYAEEWAKKQASKPTSENKKAEAVKRILELAGENETVKSLIDKYAVSKLEAKIEELLRSDKTSDEVTPK